MGTLVKRRWCGSAGLQPDRVYHCAVMPCYDKKLEASREDFWLPGVLALGLSPQSGWSCRLARVVPPLAALVAACLCAVLLFVAKAVSH